MSDHNFDSRGIGLKAQKKLLGKMASKKIAKVFIDDTSGRLLDNLHKACKEFLGTKKAAEKIMKDIIKTVIKVGILYRNDQFSAQELALAGEFKKKFNVTVMTVISFYEVEFTYDKNFLITQLGQCQGMLKKLVSRHLTEKSLGRIDNVFQFFTNPEFLDAVFRTKGVFWDLLGNIVRDLHKMLEEGTL